jgi:Leucine-rich repeat (LRR) protein
LLSKLDVSSNDFTGVADVLISPSINLVNFSDNKFSSLGFMVKSRLAYNSIQIFDVGRNNIQHNAADFLKQLPPNLKGMIVKDNLFFGVLPDPLPPLALMEVMDAGRNNLIGSLPDFSRSMSRVSKIDLSDQKNRGAGGLSGSIPQELSSLLDLTELDISGNYLTGSIPPPIGNIPRLKSLNLSNNELTGVIDKELGKLSGTSPLLCSKPLIRFKLYLLSITSHCQRSPKFSICHETFYLEPYLLK